MFIRQLYLKSTICLTLTTLLMAVSVAGLATQAITSAADTLTNSSENNPDQQLTALMDNIWNWKVEHHPEFATSVGYATANDRWTDFSTAAIMSRKTRIERYLRELEQIDRNTLSEHAQLDYEVVQYNLQLEQSSHRFPQQYLQISQMDGVQSSVPYILKISPRSTLQDYENLLTRLSHVPVLIDQTIALLETGRQSGITQAGVSLRNLPLQIEGLLDENPQQSPLFEAFKHPSDQISARQRKTIQKRAEQLLTDTVFPAFNKLKEYLVNSHLPGTRQSIALSDLPNGKAWYQHQISYHTSTNMTAEEIHKIGWSEVRRIRKEMNRVINNAGFSGNFKEFADHINSDQQFFFNNTEELLAGYRDLCKRADAKMPQLFYILPRLPYGVDAVATHLEKSSAAAYYYPGSIEASRAGMFYVNTYDLKSRPKWLMQALTLHEAVPGHHLQIAIAQELQDTHTLRKHLFWTAFVEGWGLYAESLGYDIGFYQDPYSEFGRLSMEMMRAIRLVVDTGMHALGWSRQQAIDFFKQNSATPEHDIVVEIDRYIVWPGQALAYKIGELKIKELRAQARRQLGEDFDIREFHDKVLDNGAVPLYMLENMIERWIAEVIRRNK
jgi:uncharacterized protein (DUF885 family)